MPLPSDDTQPGTALQAPILLLIFNRPDTTRRVFDTIRKARPTRLYVAADGPRANHPTDAARCAATRAVVSEVDWPCEVFTLFRTENLNCGVAPATAMDWFFSHEEEGIILEDDCVPAPSFFRFCEELLARYRHDTRVMHIGGNNYGSEARQPLDPNGPSYYFSGQRNSWGWATWRRAWSLYDYHQKDFHKLVAEGAFDGVFSSRLEKRYRLGKMESVFHLPQPADVWDYQWEYTIAVNSGLYIVPAVNLVGNIGFGDDSTHTFDAGDLFGTVSSSDLTFPLRHPDHVMVDYQRDKRRFNEFLFSRITAKVRRVLTRSPQKAAQYMTPKPSPVAPAATERAKAVPS
ncbi:nucleotide-diphospho-sugar transferase [Hymenobacter cavernae]|uniref:Hemolytic protein HlpA n=1 Tax=Hymenobacter cavernae TaxID=2044852 RepID=A0ABQ1TS27_9BACT|nr:nucleotide-diphospho-sugar transferase [Hymenobacter cavernae]GGF01606.1 hemolytic protein HlpA [Hymenobacter cavernae]